MKIKIQTSEFVRYQETTKDVLSITHLTYSMSHDISTLSSYLNLRGVLTYVVLSHYCHKCQFHQVYIHNSIVMQLQNTRQLKPFMTLFWGISKFLTFHSKINKLKKYIHHSRFGIQIIVCRSQSFLGSTGDLLNNRALQ